MLPAVRMPVVNGEYMGPDGAVLEISPTNKFSVSWPSDAYPIASTPPPSERPSLSSSEESETSDGDSGNEHGLPLHQQDTSTPPTAHVKTQLPVETLQSEPIPRFSRALSMPLPSQLGYLRNPHKSDSATTRPPLPKSVTTLDSSRLRELSVELADSVQMMIQTMLQVSPPQLLDPAKEQFSACALSVPASSVSAMFATMKNLNFISANMANLCSNPIPPTMKEGIDVGELLSVGTSIRNDFDIAEMLQSVGDSLSGAAAQAGVDLVLYHGDDIGLRHVCVKGDENGISYALSHVRFCQPQVFCPYNEIAMQVIRQVLLVALPGDSIELGLLVSSHDPKSDEVNASFQTETGIESSANPPPLSPDGPLSCTIRISHKYRADSPAIAKKSTQRAAPTRTNPNFDYLLLHRLLRQIGATLNPDLPPPINFADGRICDFTLMLDRGSLSLANTPMVNDFSDEDPMAGEPTVDQLTFFAESLKGRRVTLYASPKGSFARHLTGSLTSWGMDVTHVSPDGAVDGFVNFDKDPSEPRTPMPTSESKTPGLPLNGAERPCAAMYFIFIDDDVEVLKERLHALRAEHTLRKRPSLAAHHRPRSSPQIARSMGSTQSTPPPTSSVVVVHFTSLSNYKLIKDVVQSVVLSHAGSSIPLPEVMIIPKPAGPRRFLTALHTAVTKPTVDPFFVPIATSPTSPGVYHIGSFFRSYHNAQTGSPKTSTKSARPAGSRTNSDRSTKSSKDILDYVSHCPPSPLGMSDNVEYFSETATKLGSSPSSGLVIQSPDGQPAGIFFHPRSKTIRNPPTHSMERDKGQLFVPSEKRDPPPQD
jgi:osomolarity two-component system response regulator SSK1